MAVLVANALKLSIESDNETSFADDKEIPSGAIDAARFIWSRRGETAHTSSKTQQPIDLISEKKDLEVIMYGLEEVDEKINEILKPHRELWQIRCAKIYKKCEIETKDHWNILCRGWFNGL
ncbi:hypothetical protein BC351_30090 [Paenibacillus ferrarius]|uniref:Uncharacterized protein n=1 Tax=Paenibacillus ferrarius TaxID=1469647 RepID=A0A1V4HHN7_9BACL|nr:hypothetical protein [Paenibacillus ferrarius]OPH54973.1 hypothetical protein BC351_30090 [Paenibacillus ferrarius]